MARKSHDREKVEPRAVHPADVWAADAAAAVAVSMAAWLKGSVQLSRPISSLTRDELERLATGAINTWIVLASKRMADMPEDSREIRKLLM